MSGSRRRSGVDVVVEIDHAVFVLPFAIIGIGLHRRRGDRLAQFGQVFQRVDARLAVFDDGAVLADGDEFADYGVGRDVAALNGNDSRARTVLFAEGKRRDGDGLLVGGSAALRGDEAHQSDDVLTSHWLFVERVRLELPPSSVKCRLSLLSSIE